MARRTPPPPLDLRSLLSSWELHLRAERKSPATVKQYGDGVRRFLAWCSATTTDPALDRPTVNAFVAALLDEGAEPAPNFRDGLHVQAVMDAALASSDAPRWVPLSEVL